jgi:hypothetical protein
MFLKLKSSLFSRNRTREKEVGAIFNKTSSGISNLIPVIIPIFFAPALVTTSVFSKEIILMLANISLSLGYVSNFAYRIYHNEVSKSELLITALIIASLIAVGYFFYPTIIAYSFVKVLGILNQIAAAVNFFFLVKDVIIPPCKRALEKVAHFLGVDITSGYYFKRPLTLEEDRHILDRLLTQAYGHDSFSPKFQEKKIESFNRLLKKLCAYINKYDESFLGYLWNKEVIATLESQVNALTSKGSPDASYTFIHKKISYKTTKLKLLEAAKKEVEQAIKDPKLNAKKALRFFSCVDETQIRAQRTSLLSKGLRSLNYEIKRQQGKIDSLQGCLPEESPSNQDIMTL